MFGVNRPKSRFSLVLLEEGEYYFDDFSAFYYPPARDDEDSFRKYELRDWCYRHIVFTFVWINSECCVGEKGDERVRG